MPTSTLLRDAVITLLGGVLQGLERLDINLRGEFHVYPNARIYSDEESVIFLDHVQVILCYFTGKCDLYYGTSLVQMYLNVSFYEIISTDFNHFVQKIL